MSYKVIKKMYRTPKDMNPDKPYRTVNMTEGWKPLTEKEAEIVKSKMVYHPLWIYQVLPA